MISEADTIGQNATLDTDICIVGGGTAGIALAREFIGQQFRVCLLESGGMLPEPEATSLNEGENVGYPYYALDAARARCFGGSSTKWHIPIGGDRLGMRLRPLDPIDFEERDWVPFSGWPFRKAHLDPYYERAQHICRVAPITYAVEDWEDHKRRRVPLNSDQLETIIYKFGWKEIFVREYPQEVSRAENVTTLLHANVLEMETSPEGERVDRLRVGARHGEHFFVTAKRFILAAGGIEIPRLLLLSNKVQKSGLGNDHDLVGRFFMEHLHFWSGFLVPNRPDVFETTALYNDIHTVNGVPIIGKLALPEKVLRCEKLLNQNVQLIPLILPDPFRFPAISTPAVQALRDVFGALFRREKMDGLGRNLAEVLRHWDEVALAIGRKMRRTLIKVPRIQLFRFANMAEQAPHPNGRVTLGSERDQFGQQRVRLDWQVTAEDIRSIRRTQDLMAAALERSGFGRFYKELLDDTPPATTHGPPATTHGGYHHIGTTRMHVDAKQGVVDPDCRVHGISNLFIAGPSVFPTGGYANPVLTMLALTLRLADHVKKLMNGPSGISCSGMPTLLDVSHAR
jgi:choline dehydrogenase-like flavoprotein